MHVEPLGSFFSSLHSLLSFFVFLCLSVCVLHSSLLLSVFVFLFVLKLRSLHFSLEVTVTSLHPPRLCRIAVFSIKPTFLSAPSGFFVHVGCLLFAPRGFRWLTEPNEVALAPPGQIKFPCHTPCLCRFAVFSYILQIKSRAIQLGRVGGSRWGSVLQIKTHAMQPNVLPKSQCSNLARPRERETDAETKS